MGSGKNAPNLPNPRLKKYTTRRAAGETVASLHVYRAILKVSDDPEGLFPA
jgi:hypothetical protein